MSNSRMAILTNECYATIRMNSLKKKKKNEQFRATHDMGEYHKTIPNHRNHTPKNIYLTILLT